MLTTSSTPPSAVLELRRRKADFEAVNAPSVNDDIQTVHFHMGDMEKYVLTVTPKRMIVRVTNPAKVQLDLTPSSRELLWIQSLYGKMAGSTLRVVCELEAFSNLWLLNVNFSRF
ncbi:hypothetical protein BH10PAT4_BH10PAT4_4340 [soil metagenome]